MFELSTSFSIEQFRTLSLKQTEGAGIERKSSCPDSYQACLQYQYDENETFKRDIPFSKRLMSETNQQANFPSGIWNGFFIEGRPERGWMHLYLDFRDGEIKGEGTDYVGPWHIRGQYDEETGACSWIKQYLGKHQVVYSGFNRGEGIVGEWTIGDWLNGTFHIWPQGFGGMEEKYLQEDMPAPNAF